jgi:very-short-patch-repair endonuclease
MRLSEAPTTRTARGAGGKPVVAFRRQVPLAGRFIADFYAAEVRLVVEVDGGYHEERRGCAAGPALERLGYHVLRIGDELVTRDLQAAVGQVRGKVEALRGERAQA